MFLLPQNGLEAARTNFYVSICWPVSTPTSQRRIRKPFVWESVDLPAPRIIILDPPLGQNAPPRASLSLKLINCIQLQSETEYSLHSLLPQPMFFDHLPPRRHETGVEVRSEGPPDNWCLPPPLGNPHPILLSRWSVSWSVRFTIYILRYSLLGQYSLQLMIVALTLLSLSRWPVTCHLCSNSQFAF